MKKPQADQIIHKLKAFDNDRKDPYFWMNQRDSQKVLDHLKEEKKYFEEHMDNTLPFQKKLFEELKSRIPAKDSSAPYPFKQYIYQTRYEDKKEYPLYCRKKVGETKEEIFLDVNQLAEGNSYYSLGDLEFSQSQNIVAFSADSVGRRVYTIFFKDLKTQKILPQNIPQTTGEIVWAQDEETIFYTKQDPQTLRSHQVYRYNLHSQKEECIFEEKDETFDVSVYKSLSEQFIYIQSSSTLTTEYRVLPANKPYESPKVFLKRKKGHKYYLDDGKDVFYILTNSNSCTNYRLDVTPLDRWNMNDWKTIFPHDEDIYIEDFEVFSNFIALECRKDSLAQVLILDRKTHKISPLNIAPQNSNCYVVEVDNNANYETDVLRVSYESMTQPEIIYDYSISKGTKKLIKEEKIAVPYDSSLYHSERFFISDQKIPLSILYKKDLFKKGKNPLYLYGYGSYGISIEPTFSSHILSLLDRGFVFAIAHIRGGAEKGKKWYEDGKLLKKKNTFKDFIDCAQYLIDESWAHPQKLYVGGGSAGGLLMGSVLNMRPDLFNGVIAQVPFVDVVTTMQDSSIPLTSGEYDEWGNPNDLEYYNYMKSYSPYDNVEKNHFPSMLITSGYHDSQVQYWEPMKWVSRLRDFQQNDNPILLYMDMESGHGGTTGRFKKLKQLVIQFSFLLQLENLHH